MIDLKNYKGFAFQSYDNSRERQRLISYFLKKDVEYIIIKNKKEKCPVDYIPCGSVKWCLNSLDMNIIPNYYPDWLKPYLNRKVWQGNEWILGRKLFVKPADRYKRFTGFVTYGTYSKKKKSPYWWSEIVKFENEWRCYISNGEILSAEWYWGDDKNTPDMPKIYLKIPSDYCGAVDFGYVKSIDKICLVEAHHPFACGWYGFNDSLYAQWLIDGWEYMLNNFNKRE